MNCLKCNNELSYKEKTDFIIVEKRIITDDIYNYKVTETFHLCTSCFNKILYSNAHRSRLKKLSTRHNIIFENVTINIS